jgi:DNA-binding NarL/FixJ family response regulator
MPPVRVALVGSPADRGRLRARVAAAAIEIAAEFDTIAAAEASDVDFDMVMTERHNRSGPTRRSGPDEALEALTTREVQVLELLAEGLPNKAIAERLGISDQTVKFHVSSISGKLGAANRTDAVRRAVRRGLVTL